MQLYMLVCFSCNDSGGYDRHNCAGIFSSADKATAAALFLLDAEKNPAIVWEILPFELDRTYDDEPFAIAHCALQKKSTLDTRLN